MVGAACAALVLCSQVAVAALRSTAQVVVAVLVLHQQVVGASLLAIEYVVDGADKAQLSLVGIVAASAGSRAGILNQVGAVVVAKLLYASILVSALLEYGRGVRAQAVVRAGWAGRLGGVASSSRVGNDTASAAAWVCAGGRGGDGGRRAVGALGRLRVGNAGRQQGKSHQSKFLQSFHKKGVWEKCEVEGCGVNEEV